MRTLDNAVRRALLQASHRKGNPLSFADAQYAVKNLELSYEEGIAITKELEQDGFLELAPFRGWFVVRGSE